MKKQLTKIEHNEISNAVGRIILSFVPGSTVFQEFIEFKGRVQQERLNKFNELLIETIEKLSGIEIAIEDLTTEEVVDLLPKVLNKVVQTKSEEKLKRYRNILLKQVIEKKEDELTNKFFNLLDEVNETQFFILDVMFASYVEEGKFISEGEIFNYFESQQISLTETQLSFYMSDMERLGILEIHPEVKPGIIGIGTNGKEIRKKGLYRISEIGTSFIKFVSEY